MPLTILSVALSIIQIINPEIGDNFNVIKAIQKQNNSQDELYIKQNINIANEIKTVDFSQNIKFNSINEILHNKNKLNWCANYTNFEISNKKIIELFSKFPENNVIPQNPNEVLKIQEKINFKINISNQDLKNPEKKGINCIYYWQNIPDQFYQQFIEKINSKETIDAETKKKTIKNTQDVVDVVSEYVKDNEYTKYHMLISSLFLLQTHYNPKTQEVIILGIIDAIFENQAYNLIPFVNTILLKQTQYYITEQEKNKELNFTPQLKKINNAVQGFLTYQKENKTKVIISAEDQFILKNIINLTN